MIKAGSYKYFERDSFNLYLAVLSRNVEPVSSYYGMQVELWAYRVG